jgi:GNAT superfamily N-acetyltransferase
MLLARIGEAVACGSLSRLSPEECTVAEFKGIHVMPEVRGLRNGVSDILVGQLKLFALEYGCTKICLQTSRNMRAADSFYEQHGYSIIPNYDGCVNRSSMRVGAVRSGSPSTGWGDIV